MPSEPEILLENRARVSLNSRVKVIINMWDTDSGTLQRSIVTEISEARECYLQEENVKYFFPNFSSPQISQIRSSRSRITGSDFTERQEKAAHLSVRRAATLLL